MSWKLDFSLATQKDDAELRALLRHQALPGWVSISFEREPDYFAASCFEGEYSQVLLARDHKTGELAAFCSRAARRVFVNGEIHTLGYLGQLRSAPDWQNSYRTYRALSKGFAAIQEQLHHSNELAFHITSILSDNTPARRMLAASLPGMPKYQAYSSFTTLVYRCSSWRFKANKHRPQVIKGASVGLAAISHFLQKNYQHYQFSPVWDEAALKSAGLSADNFLLLYNGSAISACIAIWDQRHYKQAIVRAYKKPLNFLRTIINLISPIISLPYLPPVGTALNQAWLSHLACDKAAYDDLDILLKEAFSQAAQMGLDQLMLGLADDHPLLKRAQKVQRHLTYRSDLYLIHWDKNNYFSPVRQRPLHVEVATL